MASTRPTTPPPSSQSRLRVLVVDDHPLFRKGLVDVLGDDAGLEVCAEAGTVADGLAAARGHRPDVAIVDLSLGDESGLDLITALLHTNGGIRVLVLSGHDERIHADRALRAGALGYIMKDKAAAELLGAVRRVAAGKAYVSEDAAERILTTLGGPRHGQPQSPLDRLSDRERQVLTLTGRGLGTRAIADQLDVSIKTVESHYAHIKDKLGVRTGRELMRVAVTWAEHDR